MGGYQRRKRTPVNVYGTRWDPLSHCDLARLSPRASNTAHKELGLSSLCTHGRGRTSHVAGASRDDDAVRRTPFGLCAPGVMLGSTGSDTECRIPSEASERPGARPGKSSLAKKATTPAWLAAPQRGSRAALGGPPKRPKLGSGARRAVARRREAQARGAGARPPRRRWAAALALPLPGRASPLPWGWSWS